MFIYDLEKRKVVSGVPIDGDRHSTYTDSIQQSGDAVLLVIPYSAEDTFSFKDQASKPMIFKEGEVSDGSPASIDELMQVEKGVLLDNLLLNLQVQHSKAQYTGSLSAVLLDPNNNLLSILNPGDWIVCWMFDRHEDAIKRRESLAKGYSQANNFNSGLKFVGKIESARMRKTVGASGIFMKQITLQALSFSELGTAIYYDPLMSKNWADVSFIQNVNEAVNSEFSGKPRSTNEMVSSLLCAFLGNPPSPTLGPNYNQPLRIPSVIGNLLGETGAKAYLDILQTYIGVQKYGTGTYYPNNITASNQALPNVYFTPDELLGYPYPLIAPFNNVPIWSAVQQNSVPLINEMYTALRANFDGIIMPTVVIRQIPFNTEDFVSSSSIPATSFRELPRWKVTDKLVTSYDTGKTGAMRVNYVQVQPANGFASTTQLEALMRSQITPMTDLVDVQRNGLRPFISQVYASDVSDMLTVGQEWNALVTDRMIGGHLKLSGSIGLAGVQEPIAVGDNLEYDGFIYHIESIVHSLSVQPQTGFKSFSTQLAISSGVPASGPVLPEVGIRTLNWVSVEGDNGDNITAQGYLGTKKVVHSATPATNFAEDLDG